MSFLGSFQRKQITFQSVILDFGVEFIDVISKTKQKNLQFYFGFPAKQKSLESIVAFQNTKGSFHLDGTVHSVLNSCFTHDVLIGNLPFLYKVLGYIQSFISLGFGTFFFMRASTTIGTFVYSHLGFIAVFTFLFLYIYIGFSVLPA